MGNKQSSAILLAIIKDPSVEAYDKQDYYKLFKRPDQILCATYDDFDQFIEKQSLKNLHNILIVEGIKKQQNKNLTPDLDQNKLMQHLIPIHRALNKTNLRQKVTARQKIINYIKKYSLEYLNLYVYVKDLNQFIIPQDQMSYVTMVSPKAQNIIHHILNQQKQKIIAIKFKSLIKDLYRRKQVFVFSKFQAKDQIGKASDQIKNKNKQNNLDSKKQVTSSKNETIGNKVIQYPQNKKKLERLKQVKQIFENSNIQYFHFSSIDEIRKKIKSTLPEFIICMEKQDVLELIQFKKKMPIEPKIIYYGKEEDLRSYYQNDLNSNEAPINFDNIYDKKIKQVWWTSNNMTEQIVPVIQKWWISKTSNNQASILATNIVVYLTKCQNIIKRQLIKQSILEEIRKQQNLGQRYISNLNFSVEYLPARLLQRIKQDLYTIVFMFDSDFQQFEWMKKIILVETKGQPRVQISLLEMDKKQLKQIHQQTIFKNKLKKQFKQPNLSIKFTLSPIQNITCFNLSQDQYDFFESKMGLKVSKINSDQATDGENGHKSSIKDYFPKKRENENAQFCQFELKQVIDSFYIVCNLEDYFTHIFPQLVGLCFCSLPQNEPIANQTQNKLITKLVKKQKQVNDKKQYQQQRQSQWDKQFKIIGWKYPPSRDIKWIQNYLSKIKVIIYGELDCSQDQDNYQQLQYNLNSLLQIHQYKEDCIKYIQHAIRKYFKIIKCQDTKQSAKQEKKKLSNKINDLAENIYQRFCLFDESNSKKSRYFKNNQKSKANSKIKLPNVEFAHYRLTQIQNYLDFCKYKKLSVSSFPKGSLDNFSNALKKTENAIRSRSFFIEGTFVSNNNLLRQVLQRKNAQQSSSRNRTSFVKFSLNKPVQIIYFQDYIRKFSRLWKLKFDLVENSASKNLEISPQGSVASEGIQILKEEIIRVFKKCKNYELLKIGISQFKHFYINKIKQCQTLLDLQVAAIYIYSLPHGLTDVINAIFDEPSRTVLSIQYFSSFLLLLFLNFISFESNSIQRVRTVMYIQENQMIKLFNSLKQNQIVYNKSLLPLLANQNQLQNQKNCCIFFDYQNIPLENKTSISSILKVERFSFYKQSAQYLIAPFTKLRLVKKQIVKEKYLMHFKVVQQQNEVNIFLSQIFKVNDIDELSLFEQLYYDINFKKGSKGRENEQNDQLKGYQSGKGLENWRISEKENPKQYSNTIQNTNQQSLKNNAKQKKLFVNSLLGPYLPQNSFVKQKDKKRQKKVNFQKKLNLKQFSLYRKAQQIALQQQKQNAQESIQKTLNYLKMMKSINQEKYFTAQKYFTNIFSSTLNELDEDKKFIEVTDQLQLQKLKIQRAAIYTKMRQFTKALDELDNLLQFIQYQKIDDQDNWLRGKILSMREILLLNEEIRQSNVQNMQQTKKWKIQVQQCQFDDANLFALFNTESNENKNSPKSKKKQSSNNNLGSNSKFYGQRSDLMLYNNSGQKGELFYQNNPSNIYQEEIFQEKISCKFISNPCKWKVEYNQDYQTFVLLQKKSLQNNLKINPQISQLEFVADSFNLFNKNTYQDSANNQPDVTLGDVLLQNIGNRDLRDNSMGELKGVGTSITNEKQIKALQSQINSQGALILKFLRLFIIFKQQVSKLLKNQNQLQKLSKLPQKFMLQLFQQIFSEQFREFYENQKSQQRQLKNYDLFLKYIEEKKGFKYDKLKKVKIQILEKYQQLKLLQARAQKLKNINSQTNQADKCGNCWIDHILNINSKDAMKWVAYQFDSKFIVTESNRKFKQSIKNIDLSIPTFNRSDNEVIQRNKVKNGYHNQ